MSTNRIVGQGAPATAWKWLALVDAHDYLESWEPASSCY